MMTNSNRTTAKGLLRQAVRVANAGAMMSYLKVMCPGAEHIPERIAAFVTDAVPTKDRDRPILHKAVAEGREAFLRGVDEWRAGAMIEREILYRYVVALLGATLDVQQWRVLIVNDEGEARAWDPVSDGDLIDYYDCIVELCRVEDGQEREAFTMQDLMERFLTDRDLRMIGCEPSAVHPVLKSV